MVSRKNSSQWNSFCTVQPPVYLIKCTNLPTAFTTFSHHLRHLSIHCIIVRPTLSLRVNISCLKCPLLTDACLVTCKPYINFFYSHCIFCIFFISHFVLYCFYLRTSVAFINKIIVIVNELHWRTACDSCNIKILSQLNV